MTWINNIPTFKLTWWKRFKLWLLGTKYTGVDYGEDKDYSVVTRFEGGIWYITSVEEIHKKPPLIIHRSQAENMGWDPDNLPKGYVLNKNL